MRLFASTVFERTRVIACARLHPLAVVSVRAFCVMSVRMHVQIVHVMCRVCHLMGNWCNDFATLTAATNITVITCDSERRLKPATHFPCKQKVLDISDGLEMQSSTFDR